MWRPQFGAPNCTELPPKNDTMNPPMIAVIRPIVGLTPDAIPNAMASGSATIPTTMPAVTSDFSFPALYERNALNNLGWKSMAFPARAFAVCTGPEWPGLVFENIENIPKTFYLLLSEGE